jgi:hypothetical protein
MTLKRKDKCIEKCDMIDKKKKETISDQTQKVTSYDCMYF